jgi:large subunit ribosomal protein L9
VEGTMKVILIADEPSLGKAGEIVQVKDGFARNYLIPKKKALPATPDNLNRLEQMRKQLEASKAKARQAAETLSAKLEKMDLVFRRQAAGTEKLFGSVTSMDIEKALKEKGIEVDRKRIQLPEPIKQLGEFTVPVKLHPEVTANLRVKVVKA